MTPCKKEKCIFLFFVVIIKIIYDNFCINYKDILFQYQPNAMFSSYYIISFILFVIFLIIYICIHIKKTFVSMCFDTILLMYFIPLMATTYFQSADLEYFVSVHYYIYLFLFMLILFEACSLSKSHVKSIAVAFDTKLLDKYLLGLFGIIALIVFLYGNSFSTKMPIYDFDLVKIYQIRAINADIITNQSGIISVIIMSIIEVILPLYTMYFIKKNKYLCLLCCFILQVYYFAINTEKGFLFVILLELIALAVYKCSYLKRNITLLPAMGTFCLFGFANIEQVFFKSDFIYVVFIRRLFYIPAELSYKYFLFFQNNPKLFFTEAVFLFSKFFPKDNNISYNTQLANFYESGRYVVLNNGLFGEAYMQLGYLGLLVFPFIVTYYIYVTSKYMVKSMAVTSLYFAIIVAIALTNVPVLSMRPLLIPLILWLVSYCLNLFLNFRNIRKKL